MSAKQKLADAFCVVNEESVSVKLYIITRHIKDGLKKTTKAIDKYKFLAHTVDLSPDLNNFYGVSS